jgi:hypothetical protein
MEETECSETSAYTIQTPGNYPEKKHSTNRIPVFLYRTVQTSAVGFGYAE